MANDYEGNDSYQRLLELEELESLQEEIEEAGLDPDSDWSLLPVDLREHATALGVINMSDLITRIAYMHAELDEQ